MKRAFLSIILSTFFALCFAASPFVSTTEGVSIIRNGKVGISISPDAPKGVSTAADNLKRDLHEVCSAEAVDAKRIKDATVIIATLGDSNFSALEKSGVLQKGDFEGKKEMFIIKTDGGRLIIAGSDRRGTIYGIYELSRQAGVSPWYWWADVPVERKNDIRILPGVYSDGEPSVEWGYSSTTKLLASRVG